jgi:hypothetical protein
LQFIHTDPAARRDTVPMATMLTNLRIVTPATAATGILLLF